MNSTTRALLPLIVVASVGWGCLDNPMNPNNASNTATNNDAGATSGQECDDCTIGEKRCHETEDGVDIHQICVGEFDEGGDECPAWETQEACTAAQSCSADEGCKCSSTCTPGERACKPGGLFVCMIVDGCAVEVDVCRAESCDPAPNGLDCDEHPDSPHCQPCGGPEDDEGRDPGRACVEACPGVNDCYTCGG